MQRSSSSRTVSVRAEIHPTVRDTEFAYTPSDFRRIADLLYAECGISLSDSKANLVYSRLVKRLRATGQSSFRDYCRLVASEEGAEERHAMIAAMTTNVTRFFREPHHFEHLRTVVLPRLTKTMDAGGKVRIWSAGCSSGEEPYSIAMTVLAAVPNAQERDIKILATDIDPQMVTHGRAAIYPEAAVDSVPSEFARTSLVREKSGNGKSYRIADRVRSLVRFNELNLLSDWPMKNRFDVIFCRNVMIYFDDDTQLNLCRRFAAQLSPNGVLYIGHSERIPVDALPFVLRAQTTYERR